MGMFLIWVQYTFPKVNISPMFQNNVVPPVHPVAARGLFPFLNRPGPPAALTGRLAPSGGISHSYMDGRSDHLLPLGQLEALSSGECPLTREIPCVFSLHAGLLPGMASKVYSLITLSPCQIVFHFLLNFPISQQNTKKSSLLSLGAVSFRCFACPHPRHCSHWEPKKSPGTNTHILISYNMDVLLLLFYPHSSLKAVISSIF